MGIPIPASVENTAAGYINYLGTQIDVAGKVWTHYAWAVSAGYAKAWDRVNLILGQVKQIQEARRQLEHDLVTFFLSAVTLGIGGAGAGAIARLASESRDMQDGVKKMLDKVWSSMSDPVINDLSPDKNVNADAFAPPGMTPPEHTASLHEGITYQIALLAKLLEEVQYNPAGKNFGFDGKQITLKSGRKLTAEDAKRLTEMVLNSTFFTEQPSIEMHSANLAVKAELALWMGWVQGRDTSYWSNAEKIRYLDVGGANKPEQEQFDWLPVARELISLGVPATQLPQTEAR